MKQFFALYVKELKAHKVLFLFVLLLIAGMNVYGLLKMANISQEQIVAQEQLGIILKFVLFVMLPINLAKSILVLSLPFLLVYTFSSEWRSETHYQMFALPLSQYTVILVKIAAVASFILFLSFGFFILQGLSVFKSLLMPILPFAYSESTIFLKTSVDIYFFTILMGIIFMIIGLVMYEKRAEI